MADFLEKVKGFFGKVGAAIKSFFGKVGAAIKKAWDKVSPPIKKVWGIVAGAVSHAFKVCIDGIKKGWSKVADLWRELTKDVKWKVVWDKCTTGLLIFLMASPILILAYIFLWFLLR